MSSTKTPCPACGHLSQDPEWCDNCGAPLEAPRRDPATQEFALKPWLEPEDTLVVRCDLERLLDAHTRVQGMASLEVVLEDVLESSSVRHICRARFERVLEVEGSLTAEQLTQQLTGCYFTTEELGALLGAHNESLPAEVAHLVRRPAGQLERGDHVVRLFREDASSTLEEYLFNAQGQLDYSEVKDIFGALLDLVEQLHTRRYLYLRLSPWTLRVIRSPVLLNAISIAQDGEITEVEDEEAEAAQAASVDDTDHMEGDEVDEVILALADAPVQTLLDEPPQLEHPARESQDAAGEDAHAEEEHEEDAPHADAPEEDKQEEAPEEQGEDGPAASAQETILDHLPEAPTGRSSLHEISSSAYDLEELSAPSPTLRAVEGALLDGGFRFYRAREDYEEVPVVIGFSPPEMFGRSRVELGPHCDIFSLGMLLYFLVAGELPPTSIYSRHIPAIPSRHFRPGFPIGLQAIISRATRPAPGERFADVATLRHAFERACKLIEQRIDAMQYQPPSRIEFAVERHIGIAKRLRNPVNQDNVFGAKSADSLFSLLVVADGVSTASYGSGDLASEQIRNVATERWPELLALYESDPDEVDEFELITSLMKDANQRIIDYVNLHHFPFEGVPHEVMGTTVLVAIINRGIVTLGSLGDSRGYLQRGTSFEQITIDHNLWTLRILEGESADHALSLPHGDALARCLGSFIINDNKLNAITPQPDIFRFPVMSGDTLLLATDGLLDFAGANPLSSEDNILSILLAESNPALAALEMILLANRGGGGDNIGISITKFL